MEEPYENRIGKGGWVSWRSNLWPGLTVYTKFEESADGRMDVVSLLVDGPVTSSALKQMPVRKWEGLFNQPSNANILRERLRLPGPDVLAVASGFFPLPTGGTGEGPRTVPAITGTVNAVERADRSSASGTARQVDDYRIKIPVTRPYPDEFYAKVADLYLSTEANRPAVEIAEANDVPLTTAHRWIREARKRGLLHSRKRSR